jgi:mannose-6-phosphate isomerase-like protein (cupin superfamily)
VLVTNSTSVQSGLYYGFKTSLLIGESNSGSKEISIQITEVEPQKMQFLHSHDEEQCYYIVRGTGLMFINSEEKNVGNGDAVFIPSNASHGIENIGSEKLVYLTANKAFGLEKERSIWPLASGK